MNKAFSNFTWENDPSVNTPLSAENLNRVNKAVNEIDNRVISHDTTKANQVDMLSAITNVTFDESTGKFTFIRHNGTMVVLDTKLEKLILNWRFDNTTQILYMVLEDGSEMPVDLSAFVTNVEFADSNTIRAVIGTDGKVGFDIIDGSITADKLEPNYLANVQLASSQAATSATSAAESAESAEASALRAEEAADIAQSVSQVDIATTSKAGIVKPDGTTITVDADGTIHGVGGAGDDYVTKSDLDARIAVIPEEEGGGFKVNGSLIAYDTLAVMASSEDAASAIGGLDHYGQLMWALMGMGSDLGWMDYAYNVHTILDTNNFKSNITPSAIGAATTADLANYLPLDGGGTVSNSGGTPIIIQGATNHAFTKYLKADKSNLGYIGFEGVDNPVFVPTSGGAKTLHHDGNSAKVAIQSSAPTDTTSLWVY